jgi:hypothetical protein
MGASAWECKAREVGSGLKDYYARQSSSAGLLEPDVRQAVRNFDGAKVSRRTTVTLPPPYR